MIFVRDIQEATARHYAIPLRGLRSPSRVRQFAHPRQVAMALSRRLTDKHWTSIARAFDRDHSTIISGARAAEQRCVDDADTKNAMRRITLELVRR